jgi:diguanylate cyclase (GGDEF)-like protein
MTDELAPVQAGVAALLEHSRDLIAVMAGDGVVTWLSPSAQRWFGASLVGRTLADVAHPGDGAKVSGAVAAAGDGSPADVACRLRDANGAWHPMDLAVIDRRDHPTIGGLVAVARERVVHGEVAAQLIHQATHDDLTALPNRAGLLGRLEHAADEGRHGACALFYVDLDGFKAVNDTYGHAAGDRVLVAVAERLRRAVRPGDTVARLGGDEFVVVASGVADPAVATDIAQRIINGVARPIAAGGRLVTVSASVGISIGTGARAAALLEEADRAMFCAKQSGRNRSAVFTADMRSIDDQRHAAEALMRHALDEQGLAVVYQPIVDLATGRIAGVDAALRLRRADGQLGAPGGFLEIAEETGLAVAVGSGLLDLACRQAMTWRSELGGGAPALLSVPTSHRQLADHHAAGRVGSILAAYGIEPAAVCFALPEGTLADAGSDVARSLEELKALGVRLALDGFGNGRSNLAYLRRFSVDLLRIDRALMAGLGHDSGDTEVVRAVIGLGEALGMTTVATGVETAEQAGLLRDLGCQLAQGFYFGRPAEADRLALRPGR